MLGVDGTNLPAAFFSAAHTWYPGLQEVPVHVTRQFVLARLRQFLGHFWAQLAVAERSITLRERLQNVGVVLQSTTQTPDDQLRDFRSINNLLDAWRRAASHCTCSRLQGDG